MVLDIDKRRADLRDLERELQQLSGPGKPGLDVR